MHHTISTVAGVEHVAWLRVGVIGLTIAETTSLVAGLLDGEHRGCILSQAADRTVRARSVAGKDIRPCRMHVAPRHSCPAAAIAKAEQANEC